MASFRTTFASATASLALLGAVAAGAAAASDSDRDEPAVGAAVSMSRMPSSPSGAIRGRSGDLVFGGMAGQTISGLWTSPSRRRLHGFMVYLPTVPCRGGVPSVDLRRTLEVKPGDERRARSGVLTGDVVGPAGRIAATGVSTLGYSTANGDVSGLIDEEVSGSVAGDRASGRYSATISLRDEEGAPFARCSVRIAWSAQQGARRHFVGGTWLNPMYVERSADGTRVKRIRVATNLGCDDGTTWQGYTGFRDVRVRHDRFTLESDSITPWDVGELRDVTTGVGRFSGTVARGSFADEVTTTNPSVETTDHCAQAAYPWTAYSSAH